MLPGIADAYVSLGTGDVGEEWEQTRNTANSPAITGRHVCLQTNGLFQISVIPSFLSPPPSNLYQKFLEQIQVLIR